MLNRLAGNVIIKPLRSFSTLRQVSPMTALRQQNITQSLESPTALPSTQPVASVWSTLLGLQRRWKSRGNSFQPNTLKRKRRSGFLTRLKYKQGRKILARRKAKGRWYLSY